MMEPLLWPYDELDILTEEKDEKKIAIKLQYLNPVRRGFYFLSYFN